MSPDKQQARGIAGCRLVPGMHEYKLNDGTPTVRLAVTVSLLLAEPSLRRWQEGQPIDCKDAVSRGYRFVRSFDDAVAYGLL
jgi:hypothetical protein